MTIVLKFLLIFIQLNLIQCLNSHNLIFVIDISRFTRDNIKHLNYTVSSIVNVVLNERYAQIEKFSLIIFNERGVIKRISRDYKELYDTLNSTKTNHSNNNCSRKMTLQGIKRGVVTSFRPSYIYVLTAAAARDYSKVSYINMMCKEFEYQVNFILMGDCQWPETRDYKVYYEIADATSGHVFRIKDNETSSVFNVISKMKPPVRKAIEKSFVPDPPNINDITPRAPEILILQGTRTDVYYGDAIELECRVRGQIKPTIVWKDNANNTLRSKLAMTNVWYASYLYLSDLKVSKRYFCHVNNSIGRDAKAIDVNVNDQFKVVALPPERLTIEFGKTAKIHCDIRSVIPRQISWYYVDAHNVKTKLGSSSMYNISREGTELDIYAVNTTVEGTYICNTFFMSYDEIDKQCTVNITLADPDNAVAPVIDKTTVIEIEETTNLTISCKILEGTPGPNLKWQFKSRGSKRFVTIPDTGDTMRISNTVLNNAGYYKCIAENVGGSDVKITEIIVQKVPAVTILEGTNINTTYGKELSITCKVTAYPDPIITWKDDKGIVLPSEILPAHSRYEYTSLLKLLSFKRSTRFYCHAVNNVGEGTAYIDVAVTKLLFVNLEVTSNVEYNKSITIECGVKSHLPIAITWTYVNNISKETRIVRNSEKYFLPKDRTEVTISQMDFDLVGKYSCKASTLYDPEQYEIHDTYIHISRSNSDANRTAAIHNVNSLVNDRIKLVCLGPFTGSESIKWYMNGRDIMITKPYLTLSSVDLSMDGNYTCKVVTNMSSYSDTYIVNVGYKPVFMNVLSPGSLNCKANVKPEGKIEWSYNGAPVNVSTDTYELKISGLGQYICNITNIHGSVTRSFNVTSKGCFINRNFEATPYTPLILSSSSTLPVFELANERLFIKPGTRFKLSCHNTLKKPNVFQKFPDERELEVTCYHNDTFWVDEKLYKYSDFHCRNTVSPIVIKSKKQCLGDNTELIRVGFKAVEFIDIYQVCLDTDKIIPLYTRLVMGQKSSKVNTKHFKWFRDTEIGFRKISLEYSCANVLSTMCYARTQLVSVHDVPFGPAQTSTFIDHLNTVPLWKPEEDTNRMTWQAIEDNIRDIVDVNNKITVLSGASEFIGKDGRNIPRFLWKILVFEEADVTVIIYVNDPTPTKADIRCENTCNGSSPHWIQSNDSYTYCCNYNDFLTAFKIPIDITSDTNIDQI